ncbi:hypothetical protein [Haloparvum sedimenti]|uniref:hypothetical protein n=1 Tax=Haloparvum sedimenti TaxID=1678448 RepID=UPI000F7736E7|nr:hypothetical protein [Haloparvum sedimenti]
MVNLSTDGAGGGDAYTYVQDAQPASPEEGESWYDTSENAAYVYDGASWIEQTVVDHGELSGVGSGDHHAKPIGTGNQARRQSTFRVSIYANSGNSSTQHVPVVCDGCTISGDGSGGGGAYEIREYRTDNVLASGSVGENGSESVSFNPSYVTCYYENTTTFDGSNYYDLDAVVLPPHSHSI